MELYRIEVVVEADDELDAVERTISRDACVFSLKASRVKEKKEYISPEEEQLKELRRRAGAPRYDADDVKRIRENAGLTLKEMAERIGVNTSAVESWEMGTYGPSPRHALDIQEIADEVDDPSD